MSDSIEKMKKNGNNQYPENGDNRFEVEKLKAKIASLRQEIENKYNSLGKVFYEAHKDDEITEERDTIFEISSFYKSITEIEDEIRMLTEKPKCRFCGAEISANAKFCRSCGKKQEAEKVETLNACPRCGYKIDEETVYCENCGMKIERGAVSIPYNKEMESKLKGDNKCIYCGAKLMEAATFCSRCGKAVVRE